MIEIPTEDQIKEAIKNVSQQEVSEEEFDEVMKTFEERLNACNAIDFDGSLPDVPMVFIAGVILGLTIKQNKPPQT